MVASIQGPGMDPDEQIQEIIRTLGTEVEQEYPQRLLEKQHEALLEFLGVPCSNFHSLQAGFGLSSNERVRLYQPISDWYDTNIALFPGIIRGRINRICKLAGTWLSDHGLRTVNTPEVISTFRSDWDLLMKYEGILRRALVRAERSKASDMGRKEQMAVEVEENHATTIAARDEMGDIFKRAGKTWTVRFEGKMFELNDTRGVRYIAYLLRYPGRSFSAVELASGLCAGGAGTASLSSTPSNGYLKVRSDLEAGDAVVDTRMMTEVKKRLEALRGRRLEAEEHGNTAQRTACDEELAQIERYLKSAEGLAGKTRVFTTASERARKAVSNRIRDALQRVEAKHPSLGMHLRGALKTGNAFMYQPQPSVHWEIYWDI